MTKERTKKQPSQRAKLWHKTKTEVGDTIKDIKELTINTTGVSDVIRNEQLMAKLTEEEIKTVTLSAGILLNTLTDFKAQTLVLESDFLAVSSEPHEKRTASQFDPIKNNIGVLMHAYYEVILPNVEKVLHYGEVAVERVEIEQAKANVETELGDC